MKAFFKFVFVLSVTAIIFSSCARKNETGKMIPKNAMVVAQINTKSLGDNVSWNDVKQTSWYRKVYSDTTTPEWRKKILDNPGASGIDFDKELIFFSEKGTGNDTYLVVEGTVKNEKDFEQFNKNFDPAQTVKKEGKVNLIILKDKNVVGWNRKSFAYVMNAATTSSEMYSFDSTNQPPVSPKDNSDELSAACAKLFSLSSDSNLEKNEKFTDLLKENGDIHVWQNTEEIVKNSPSMGMLGMLKLDVFLKNNISTYTVNFDKGKIDVDQKGYVSKELTGVLKKYLDGKINTDMIKNIPSKNVFAILAANFKAEGITELIKLTGADGMINTYAQQMGFTLDDFAKSTNGDLMLAFTDFKMKTGSFNYKDELGNEMAPEEFNKPDFNYIFSVGVGDKPSLQKLIDAGKKIASQLGKDSVIHYAMNDKIFVLSNSDTLTNQYIPGNNNQFDFTSKINDHPIGFFIDFQKVLSVLAAEPATNLHSRAIIDQSIKIWNNLFFTGGDYKNGAFTAHTEINLVDQNTNSLKQLNLYVDEIFKIREAERTGNVNRSDSVLAPPMSRKMK